MGIGVFKEHDNVKYIEIMKKLADSQRLFMIVASSDYIYGTNYQFCHTYLGKDIANSTNQKLIQAIGRVGRNKLQQLYSIRIRDDDIIKKLFMPNKDNIEDGKNYVSNLYARGGTHALPALEWAMNEPKQDKTMKMIVFITDGAVGYEDEVFRSINHYLGNSRIFSIAIGSAPNSFLLEKVVGTKPK